MNDEQELKALYDQYNTLVNTAIAHPDQISTYEPQIKTLNQKIAAKLDTILHSTTPMSSNPDIDAARAELAQKLARIQQDYNGLIQNTDKLETLRRIRDFKKEDSQVELKLYLFAFMVLALLVLVTFMFKKSQNSDMTATMPSNPAAMAPLT